MAKYEKNRKRSKLREGESLIFRKRTCNCVYSKFLPHFPFFQYEILVLKIVSLKGLQHLEIVSFVKRQIEDHCFIITCNRDNEEFKKSSCIITKLLGQALPLRIDILIWSKRFFIMFFEFIAIAVLICNVNFDLSVDHTF